jgi:hypothetical protein
MKRLAIWTDRNFSTTFIALVCASLALPALAQQPIAPVTRAVPEPPRGVSGTVVSVSDDAVVLKQKDGTSVTVAMTRGWTVSKPRKSTAAELRLGDFIGSANADVAAGKGKANELRIFEPGYRPEYGTHSLATAGTSMTHGFIFGIAKTEGGTALEIAYPDGRRSILLPDTVGVTVSDLLPRTAAAPGVAVSSVTRASPDGIRRAARLVLSAPQL